MWRATALYFTPGEAGATKGATTGATSYSDAGRIGAPATNYYYLVLATTTPVPWG